MSAATSLRSYLLNESAITDLIGTRIYPDGLPQGVSLPAVVYSVIDSPREHSLAGPSDLARTRVQCDCYAETRAEADEVAEAIETALEGFTVPDEMEDTWIMAVELAGPIWRADPPADGSDVWHRISSLDVILYHRK